MTGSALGLRQFTFATFHQFTPELTGAERAAVFHRLSPELQEQAWRESAARAHAHSRMLFEEQCR